MRRLASAAVAAHAAVLLVIGGGVTALNVVIFAIVVVAAVVNLVPVVVSKGRETLVLADTDRPSGLNAGPRATFLSHYQQQRRRRLS